MTENTGSTSGVFNSTSFNMAKTPDNLIGLIRDAAIELARVYGTDLRVEVNICKRSKNPKVSVTQFNI